MEHKRLQALTSYVTSLGWHWTAGPTVANGQRILVTDGQHQATVDFYPKHARFVFGGAESSVKRALMNWTPDSTTATLNLHDLEPKTGNSNRLDVVKEFVRGNGWNWGPGGKIQSGEQIVVSDGNATALVNFWPRSGKMVVQGADSLLKVALHDWITGDSLLANSSNAPTVAGPHIGMDESGKGDWFGPIVVAAVYVDDQVAEALRAIGVRDSKLLDDGGIDQLVREIVRRVPPSQRAVRVVSPREYNTLHSQHGSIEILLASIYAEVAAQLQSALPSTTIVCDQFASSTNVLARSFEHVGLPEPVQYHHAEQRSIGVAAASILARAAFIVTLHQLSASAGIDLPLPRGASDTDSLEAAARALIAREGKTGLERYAKTHFKPLQVLLSEGATESGSVERNETPSTASSPLVSLGSPVWRVNYHHSGIFWRYEFRDGGFLDWYEESAAGRLYVHGRAEASSVQILQPLTQGRVWKGAREKLDEAISRRIPQSEVRNIPSVLHVGWCQQETVLGTKFTFTDGAVLNYYRGRDTLTVQGTPSDLTRAALEALPTPYWSGLEDLTDTLKKLFPDWRLGGVERQPIEYADAGSLVQEWMPLEDALEWRRFWPADQEMRRVPGSTAPCQRALVEDWATVLANHRGRRHLLANAPTGLGKTIAALVPALAWVAQDPGHRRVYYLVNRVAQHENPMRELKSHLAAQFGQETGHELTVVDIVGKSLLCRDPSARQLSARCKRSRDSAQFSALPGAIASWNEVQAHVAGDVCAYHLLQGLMSRAHVVICDYWWLFSETAQEPESSGRSGISSTNSILIVDEAHNLPLRASAELDVVEAEDDLEAALNDAPESVRVVLAPVVAQVRGASPNVGFVPSQLVPLAGGESVIQQALASLRAEPEDQFSVPERLLRLLLHPDSEVVIYSAEPTSDGRRQLIFRQVDPTPVLQRGFARVYASISMSGTLAAPADTMDELRYQVPIFGLPDGTTLTRMYASPFPQRNQRWIFTPDTRGTFAERSRYVTQYAKHVMEVGRVTPGVTAVFFSSYAFLQDVLNAVDDTTERSLIVVESRSDPDGPEAEMRLLSDYEERVRKLEQEHKRAYLFGVYQGRLAEGADFSGNLIKSVICVSLPLEYPGLYHQRLQELYSHRFAAIATARGDDVAQKAEEYGRDRLTLSLVLQACGRGIRGLEDRCAFVLADRRYEQYAWRRFLYPRPYNLLRPEQSVASFHATPHEVERSQAWDAALIAAMKGLS